MDSHRLKGIFHASPLVTLQLHRLLLAVLYRCTNLRSAAHWGTLWKRGAFDSAVIDAYFIYCADRFDLFHPTHPFYQVPDLPNAVVHPIQHLVFEASSGNNPVLFDHHADDVPDELSAASAAQHLVTYQGYAIGFGKSEPFYFSDGPLVRGFAVLVQGANLFETLVLNLQQYAPSPGDVPAWEDNPPRPLDATGTQPRGRIDYLTWQSRRIRLISTDGQNDRVSHCQIQQGYKLPKTGLGMDPAKAYRNREKTGLQPVSLAVGRAAWRDADVLFAASGSPDQGPAAFAWLADIRHSDETDVEIPALQPFAVYGMMTDPGKAARVLFWRREEMPLPIDVMSDGHLYGCVLLALRAAEGGAGAVVRALHQSVRYLLSPGMDMGGRRPDPSLVGAMTARTGCVERYWSSLNEPFRIFLIGLPEDPDASLAAWQKRVSRHALAAFDTVADHLGNSPRALRAAVRGRMLLFGLLRKMGGVERGDEAS